MPGLWVGHCGGIPSWPELPQLWRALLVQRLFGWVRKIAILVNELARARACHLMERVMNGGRGRCRCCPELPEMMDGRPGRLGRMEVCLQGQAFSSQGTGLVETGSEQSALHLSLFFPLMRKNYAQGRIDQGNHTEPHRSSESSPLEF